MKAFWVLIEITILLFLTGFFVFFIDQFYNIVFRGYAPFIATNKRIIRLIIGNVFVKDDAIIYELGCGRAGFLQAARKKFPQASLTGFENLLIPFWQARIQSWLRRANLNIIRRDLFLVDLSTVDLAYCYLNPGMMAKLEDKLKKEMKPGAILASFKFKLPDIEPFKVVLGDKADEKIYFYKF